MPLTRSTRDSVLGKRAHQSDPSSSPTSSCPGLLPTPDPTPKRSRISLCLLDTDGNKENVPPLRLDTLVDSPTTPRRPRRRLSAGLETPTRPRISTRRNASTSHVPSVPETPTSSGSAVSPPTPPQSPLTPLVPIHTRVRALLRPSCSGVSIAGRDKEREAIRDFVGSFESDDVPTTLYISGSPGSGKTALVNAVLDMLDKSDVRIMPINCMALSGIDELWERLLEDLDGGKKKTKTKPASTKEAVERLFTNLKTRCILILDELDHIAASLSSLVSLLSLPKTASKTLRVIGIANTHTLTSSFVSDSADPALIKTMHFAPYTSFQLLSILQSRLAPVWDGDDKDEARRFLPQSTLTLLTKKVSGMTGDVRALLEVLRGGIDKAVAVPAITSDSTSNPLSATITAVSPSHILAALKAYAPASSAAKASTTAKASTGGGGGATVTKVRNLGLQARLALLAILLATRCIESGVSLSFMLSSPPSKSPTKRPPSSGPIPSVTVVDATQLHSLYTCALSRSEGGLFSPLVRSEFGDLLGILEGVGLVSLSTSLPVSSPIKGGKRTFSRSASFKAGKTQGQGQEVKLVEDVRVEEALRGLGIGVGVDVSDVKEEEVRAIWHRELTRLGKESKVKKEENDKENKEKPSDTTKVFGDANED